jgi:hypothetical protein
VKGIDDWELGNVSSMHPLLALSRKCCHTKRWILDIWMAWILR